MKHSVNNLLLFRKYYNNLYNQLRNQDRNCNDYVIQDTKTLHPNLFVRRINGDLSPLHSQYNPVNEAEKWLKTQEKDIVSSASVLIYGFGLGYHIEKLIELYPDKILYIYEPDMEVLLAAMESRDLSLILKHPKIQLFGFGNVGSTIINHIINQVTKTFTMLVPGSYAKIFKNEIEEYRQQFQKAIMGTRGNIATYATFYEQWPENIILNMNKNLNSGSIAHLKNKLEGYPVIIVGSGPSLDLEIDNLKKIRGNVLVFAAGSSIQALNKQGIKPDLIGAIDGSDLFADIFTNIDYANTPMLYSTIVNNRVIEPVNHNIFHFFIHSDMITKYLMKMSPETPIFNSTSTVTGQLIQAAVYMGCDPIIFVGQDLSFPDKQYYAKDVNHVSEQEILSFTEDMEDVIENVSGGTNPTSKAMLNMIRDVEGTILLSGDSPKFINSSTNGAKIKGADYRSLANMFEQLQGKVVDRDDYLEKLDYGDSYYSLDVKLQIVKRMEKTKGELIRINEQLLKLIPTIQSLNIITDRKEMNKLLFDVNKIWNKIATSNVFDHIYQMVVRPQLLVYTRYISLIVEECDEFKKAELISKHLGFLVTYMADMTPKLISYFDQSITRIYEEQINMK